MARNRNLIPFSPLSYFPHSSFLLLPRYVQHNRALRSTCFASDHENHDFENEKRARLKWGAKRSSWGINSRRAEEETRSRSLLPKWDPVQFLHGEDVYLVPSLASFFTLKFRRYITPLKLASLRPRHLHAPPCHRRPTFPSPSFTFLAPLATLPSSSPPVMRYTTDFRASLIFLPTPPRLTEADLW